MEITLLEIEFNLIRIIANLRGIAGRASGVKNKRVSTNHYQDVEYDGLIGEYAFCKINNLFLDIIPMTRKGSYDCLFNGKRIDIKATRYKTGKLIGHQDRNEDVDVFVLAIIDNSTVRFPGYALAEELYETDNLTTLGEYKTPIYAMDQSKLRLFKNSKKTI